MNNDKARECSLTLLSSAYLVGEIFVKWAKVQISCCKIDSAVTKIGLITLCTKSQRFLSGGNQLQKRVLENLGALYKRPNNSRAEIKALSLGQCGNVWQLKVSTPDGRLPLSCLCLHLDQRANWAVTKST